MEQGATWLSATLAEAWNDLTPFLLLGWLIAALARRRLRAADRTRASMTGTAVLLVLHLATLPLVGLLDVTRNQEALATAQQLGVTLAILAGIAIGLSLLFDGILRTLRMEAPRILSDVTAAAAYIVGLIVILSHWGVNLGGLIATSAVLTAVIGFSLQDTLGNLMGGVTLQMEKTIRPGDWIKIGSDTGRVVEVRWRQTTLETRSWETLIVPNSFLAKNQITVLGRRLGQPVQWRRSIKFMVDFRHKPSDVIAVVEQALRRAPIDGVAVTPEPHCLHLDMRDSWHDYVARVWTTDLQRDEPIDSAVRTRIIFALERAGIALTPPSHAIYVTQETAERTLRKARETDARGLAALHGIELFAGMTDEELAEVAVGLRYSPFAAGETLTRQGDVGYDLYLIESGRVSVRIAHGTEVREVSVLGPGAFFGERSLMTGEMRSATTVALTDAVCWRIAKADLEALLRRRPAIADGIAATLARRAAELDSVSQDLSVAAQRSRLQDDTRQFVSRIRSFFGL